MDSLLNKIEQKYNGDAYLVIKFTLTTILFGILIGTPVYEFITLFSDSWIGAIESIISSQIDLKTFTRSGLSLSNNGFWSLSNDDTLFSEYGQVYKLLYFPLWFGLFWLLKKPFFRTVYAKANREHVRHFTKPFFKRIYSVLDEIFTAMGEILNKLFTIESKRKNTGKTTNNQRIEIECPYCAEKVLAKAKKCKHCGSTLLPIEGNEDTTTPLAAVSEASVKPLAKPNKPMSTRKKLLISLIGGIILMAIFSSPSRRVSIDVSDYQIRNICKSYIQTIMGYRAGIQSDIIKREREAYFVKASYDKDGTTYEYVCMVDLGRNEILWAGLFDGDLGRWRYEDERKLNISQDGKLTLQY